MTRRAVSRACGHRDRNDYSLVEFFAKDGGPAVTGLDIAWAVCRRCRDYIPLGPSNDAPDEVQVEMRAAEIAAGLADGGCEVSSLEAHGFNDTVPTLRGGYPVLINTSQQQAGHLAACIADHDRITEHRND
jgi:hypothetical protein